MKFTEEKLKEAKFFLDKVRESYLKYPEFNYYLNAYLGSARSVLWVMKYEFGEIENYRIWHSSYKLDEEEEKFLKKINDLRITSTKKYPLGVSEKIEWEIVEDTVTDDVKKQLKKLDKKVINFELSTDNLKRDSVKKDNDITFSVKLKKGYPYIDEFPNENVLDICNKYYEFLEPIVADCLNNFGNMVDEKIRWKREWKFTNGDILK